VLAAAQACLDKSASSASQIGLGSKPIDAASTQIAAWWSHVWFWGLKRKLDVIVEW
jgi:hypothetical protein